MKMDSSSGAKRRIALVYNDSSSKAGAMCSGNSVSGSPDVSSCSDEFVFKQDVPAMLLRDLLAKEVSIYIRSGISSGRCALCPFREFSRPCRVRLHVQKYHSSYNNWCASGVKQKKLCAALYDNDMMAEEEGFTASPNIQHAGRNFSLCFVNRKYG